MDRALNIGLTPFFAVGNTDSSDRIFAPAKVVLCPTRREIS